MNSFSFLPKKIINHSQGFTLIEVIVSLTLLLIFGLSFAYVLGNGMKANELNSEKIEATFLAQSELEKIRAARDLALGSIDNKFDYEIYESSTSNEDFVVSLQINPQNEHLIEVSVTVTAKNSSSPLYTTPITLMTNLFIGGEVTSE
ncbi:hypothetical protein AJ85_04800 [Alkalihalobacillus alcalophilus ATCC 27647 = CGMCC 1.3604]|uniref:Prepilin-type N-terminal cleavage/methylation domain-containing protein n=1 Tax=Alkalihalobacillus alcalophilus ATCC 27647 = CGMCC 1.3604 TaxID=1218173 RepID=A0A094XFP3_ALKAL|nr:prepilin-type N-terminal cleavage/methylation domain-containing protein [Alkalihalobacillus alcalophilus]KGA97620.1 hypothetical protein BALCAV_0209205 [Alkalihalobacillus alcalophilus ATCC 27647 = CGMCC 1.3604]MED1561408.1 prepilin-type N-terminal cleavage/methylation domain-containing protein [Alkalihalobacillus alcalophilus]THG91454.1 hypothetical protein AJ85_04800 [Alkalihalobacillus alcalophilus ATCC 27647 = CGMCC 1.3604]